MKTITTYIAVDETEFESKELCEEYEENLHSLFMGFIINVQFYDNENNCMLPVPNHKTWNNDMYYDELYDIYNKCAYIYIYNDLTTDVIKFNRDNYGFIIPTKKGKYKYNSTTDEWERIEENA